MDGPRGQKVERASSPRFLSMESARLVLVVDWRASESERCCWLLIPGHITVDIFIE